MSIGPFASEPIASVGWSQLSVLAQAASRASTGSSSRGAGVPLDLLLWIGVLIVVVVIGGLVLVHMQKRMLKPPPAGPGAAGIMEELRRMRDAGAMTHEEYEATRKTMARKLAPTQGQGGAARSATARPRSLPEPKREAGSDAGFMYPDAGGGNGHGHHEHGHGHGNHDGSGHGGGDHGGGDGGSDGEGGSNSGGGGGGG